MAKKPHKLSILAPERIYWGPDVPMREIRRFARAVAERFEPEKMILFGSHAYGRPHRNGDVDIVVVMPARNKHSKQFSIAATISRAQGNRVWIISPRTSSTTTSKPRK